MNGIRHQGRINHVLGGGRAGDDQACRNVISIKIDADAVGPKGGPPSSADNETETIGVFKRACACGIDVAKLRQIDLARNEHKKARQQVAAAGGAQLRLAVERHYGVVAVGVL